MKRFFKLVIFGMFVFFNFFLVGCDFFGNTTTATTTVTTDSYTPSSEQYTISFDCNGGTFISSLNVNAGSSVVLPSSQKNGYSFIGWSLTNDQNASVFTGVFHATGNLTLYARWQVNQYTISFEENGGVTVSNITQYFQSEVIEPEISREGYNFVGWFIDAELTQPYVFNTMPASNFTIYAKWSVNKYSLTYTDFDGTVLKTESIDYGTNLSNYTQAEYSERIGYTFSGWDVTLPTTMPAENITLQATYTVNQYTISFEENGGVTVSNITQYFQSEVIEPEISREGYNFVGWFIDAEFTQPYIFNTMPASNFTIYAKWSINTYNITYNLDSGLNGNNPDTYTVETATFILDNPTKEGYTFNGWIDNAAYTGNAITEITLGTTGNLTLYAKWTINQYTISYGIIGQECDPLLDISLHLGETITNISLGLFHSAALTSEGRVFTWGYNNYGQLGDGTTTNRSKPTDITSGFNLDSSEVITHIILGDSHSSALTSEGRVFTWGHNNYGQLGDGTTTNRSTPTDITSGFNLEVGETITNIILGLVHSAAITSEKRVFTWGHNDYGQLGDGTTTNRSTPTDITSGFNLDISEEVTSISLGCMHSAATTSKGRVFTWGHNNYGQLGDGTATNQSSPLDITIQFNLDVGEEVTSISLGFSHSAAITSEGQVFTWGWNIYNQLGDGTSINRSTPTNITSGFNLDISEEVTSISFGDYHSSAITSEGRVFMWGYNHHGQLGDETTTSRTTPTEITNRFNLNVGKTITSISLGGYHSAAITSEGQVYAWGYNNHGQLGDGTTISRTTPTLILFYTPELINTESYDFNTNIFDYVPIMSGYTLDGWYSDVNLTELYVFSIMPAKDINLYGKWILTALDYTISFRSNGGSNVDSITYTEGAQITSPTEPIKEGYTFDGWYSDESLSTVFVFTLMPSQDITLYAKWNINTFNITYILDGGTNGLNPNTYTIETPYMLLMDPTKEWYKFDAWFLNADFSGDVVTEIPSGFTGDITLYAKWDKITEYTIAELFLFSYDSFEEVVIEGIIYFAANDMGTAYLYDGTGYLLLNQLDHQFFVGEVVRIHGNFMYTYIGNDAYIGRIIEFYQISHIINSYYQLPEILEFDNLIKSRMFNTDPTLFGQPIIIRDYVSPFSFIYPFYYQSCYIELTYYHNEWLAIHLADLIESGYGVTQTIILVQVYQKPSSENFDFSWWTGYTMDNYNTDEHYVFYNTAGGETKPYELGVSGSFIDYTDPVKEGFDFDGWYLDSEYTNFYGYSINEIPCEDLFLYAKWINTLE